MSEEKIVCFDTAKLFLPIYGNIWFFVLTPFLITGLIYKVDFCQCYSWPILGELFSELSKFRVVINSEGLREEKIQFIDAAMCSIPVLYIPAKLIAASGFILGVIGGGKIL